MYRLFLTIIISLLTLISSAALADKITANTQRDLNLLGYNAGPVDGVSGRKTISSLEAFYNDYGGEFDGEIDKNDAEAVRSFAKRYSHTYDPKYGLVKDAPKNPWAHRFVTTLTRAGEFAQRMELRHGDCEQYNHYTGRNDKFGCKSSRERAEVISHQWRPGNDVWIGYSIRLDQAMTPDPVDDWNGKRLCTFISQLKVFDNNVNQQKFANSKNFVGGAPVFFITMCDKIINAQIVKTSGESKYNGNVRDVNYRLGYTEEFQSGWVDIAINFNDIGYKNRRSRLRIFVNGEEKVNVENFRSFFPDIYAFKYGFYRSHIKQNMGEDYVSANLIAYFDEVRIGSTMEEVMPSLDNPVD